MLKLSRMACIIPGAVLILGAMPVFGQDFPSKPIRIVTSPAGGSSDFNARMVAQGLRSVYSQPIVVDNRANTGIAAQTVITAPPDGYTLLATANAFWIEPLMRDKMPYDPKEASPVALASRAPNIIVVPPSVAANSVKELIALAKAKPGALNYGAAGAGTASHLAAELFKAMAGVNVVQVFYKGGGAAITALVGAEVQLMFVPMSTVEPFVKSGRVRALAVTSAEPSALAPGLPTVAASGLPGYESIVMTGIIAPPKTPAALIRQLNQEIVRAINQPDMKEKFLNTGVEVAATSPEQFAAIINAEMASMGKVIKDAGIRID